MEEVRKFASYLASTYVKEVDLSLNSIIYPREKQLLKKRYPTINWKL